MIEDTVTDMLDAVITWLYDLLAYFARVILLMLPPDFTSLSRDATQYGILLGSGFKVLVFASYAIVIVVGGFLMMSHETLQTRYSLREIAPRLVIGLLLVGLVWTIVIKAVAVNNDVVAALVEVDISDEGQICTDPAFDFRTDPLEECDWQEGAEYSQFAYWVSFTPRADQEIGLFHIIMIIISIACLLVLLVTSILRYIVLFFVVTLAPVALACHGLPITESFARLWWRMLGACMASSIGQAALIWMWHEMRTYLPSEDDELLGYSFITRHVYLMVLVWMMWKVHAEAFRIARGRPVKVPGSRLLAAFVMSKVADRQGGSKRKFTTPGTIWGTDMRRPPWRRERPDSEDEPAKQTAGGKKGGGALSGQGQGGPDRAPNGGGGGAGRPAAIEAPASPHDQRADAEPAPVSGKATSGMSEAGLGTEAPSWKRPLPTVEDGGFDPTVATASLRGRSNGDAPGPTKPGPQGPTPASGKPQPTAGKPPSSSTAGRGGPDQHPAPADQASAGGIVPQARPSGPGTTSTRPPQAAPPPQSTPAPKKQTPPEPKPGRPAPSAGADGSDAKPENTKGSDRDEQR